MCGLAGVLSNKLQDPEIYAFDELMCISVIRGWEGAGTAFISRGEQADVLRTVGTGTDLVLHGKFSDFLKKKRIALMGHTRFPTMGKDTNDLAFVHPHRYEHITLVHNGTMTEVAGTKVDKDKMSDSAMLTESIAKIGVKDTIKNSQGAFALVWFDAKQQTLNFLRNWERPLHFAIPQTKDKKKFVLYWASDPLFLQIICNRRYDTHKVLPLEPGVWFGYELEKPPLRPFEVKDVRPEWKSTWTGGTTGFATGKYINGKWVEGTSDWEGEDYTEDCPFLAGDNKRTVITLPGRANQNAIEWIKNKTQNQTPEDDSYRETARGCVRSGSQIREYLKKGCGFCGQSIGWPNFMNKDHPLHWFSPDEFICWECQTSEDARKELSTMFKIDLPPLKQ